MVDPGQFLNQQVRASTNSQNMRRNGGPGTIEVPGMRPGEPGYDARIASTKRDSAVNEGVDPSQVAIEQVPMPADAPVGAPPQVIQLGPASVPAVPAPPQRRLTVTFGPKEGIVMVVLEEAPAWDMVNKPFRYELPALRAMVPLLELLVPIKDMTGLLDEEDEPEVGEPTPIRRGRPPKVQRV